jgi:excisionase family DNA binding protein
MPEERRVLTPRQVAEQLVVSERTVIRLIERGELRGIRVGRQWRVPKEALEDYLRGESQEEEKGQ